MADVVTEAKDLMNKLLQDEAMTDPNSSRFRYPVPGIPKRVVGLVIDTINNRSSHQVTHRALNELQLLDEEAAKRLDAVAWYVMRDGAIEIIGSKLRASWLDKKAWERKIESEAREQGIERGK